MIRTANRLTLVGVSSLGLAIGCAIYMVGDSAFAASSARSIGPSVVVAAVVTW